MKEKKNIKLENAKTERHRTSTELNNSSESVYKLNNELKLDELILQLTEKSAELSLTHSLSL